MCNCSHRTHFSQAAEQEAAAYRQAAEDARVQAQQEAQQAAKHAQALVAADGTIEELKEQVRIVWWKHSWTECCVCISVHENSSIF